MKNKKIDWEQIKTEYITGEATQKELAQKYNIYPQQICAVSSREGWVQQRKDYKQAVENKTLEELAEIEAERNTRAIDDIMSTAAEFVEIAKQNAEVKNFISREGGFNGRSFNETVRALQSLFELLRQTTGRRTIREQDAIDIQLARLELEKNRSNSGDDNADSGICILPDILKYDE